MVAKKLSRLYRYHRTGVSRSVSVRYHREARVRYVGETNFGEGGRGREAFTIPFSIERFDATSQTLSAVFLASFDWNSSGNTKYP